jgi:hypothetical protein
MAPGRTLPASRAAHWRAVTAIVVAVTSSVAMSQGGSGAAPAVRLERADGVVVAGLLTAIDATAVRIDVDGSEQTVPVAEVRRLERLEPAAAAAAVTVTTVDGGRLTGDDFVWNETSAVVVRGGARCELPIDRIQMVAWRRPDDPDGDPAWLAELPEKPDSDYIAVGKEGEIECVACAITAVTSESVTVVVDGDTIPVKRPRVVGLRWLRTPAPPGGIRVAVAGGSLSASEVTWDPGTLLVDRRIRMPADWLHGIDYAAGRTVRLVDLPVEKVESEPFFGGLAKIEGLASFFAPRVVRPTKAGVAPAVVMRPRTVAVWRVPADSRRFRGSIASAAWGSSSASVLVRVAVDDREVFRQRIDGTTGAAEGRGAAVDLDVTGARRLAVTVDFGGDGVGCPVRLNDPVFEK